MNYLNLGCGRRFAPGWTNVDFTATGEGVIAHDLTEGIPFPEGSFDGVYHSHVVEHLPKSCVLPFLQECYRVLRPQGVLRIAVPDLEQLARTYLLALEQVASGNQEWQANYEWILLEMYDQTVRHFSGGEMRSYLAQDSIPNLEFVLQRSGKEIKDLIESERQHRLQPPQTSDPLPKKYLKQIYHFLRSPTFRREAFLKLLLGQEYEALQIGRFRLGGEVHQWMYDRHSLTGLLQHCGFQKMIQRTATESYIPNWADFCLDTEVDGSVYKPDSLFLEAIKPS
jgi:predicted SAM-dependent methyltransferase